MSAKPHAVATITATVGNIKAPVFPNGTEPGVQSKYNPSTRQIESFATAPPVVQNFSIAENRGEGEEKETIWYDVACWNPTGELAAQLDQLVKGAYVEVTGDLSVRTYTDKAGDDQAVPKINLKGLRIISFPKPKT